MASKWSYLTATEKHIVNSISIFLSERLDNRESIDWALEIKLHERVKKIALIDLLERKDLSELSEPYFSAWLLILESIKNSHSTEDLGDAQYLIQKRIKNGDRSALLIAEIVNLVRARIQVEPFSKLDLIYRKLKKVPKKTHDLFRVTLTSGKLIDPNLLLKTQPSNSFLLSLAHSLDNAVFEALEAAKRVGWDGRHSLWRLGSLHSIKTNDNGRDDPDEYHHGIAPSVKLLFSVVSHIAISDPNIGKEFSRRWKNMDSPIYLRLWAALSQNIESSSYLEIGSVLLQMEDHFFWNMYNYYPEISELRLKHFRKFDPDTKKMLIERIYKGPPKSFWPSKSNSDQITKAKKQLIWDLLRKLQLQGNTFSEPIRKFIENGLTNFHEDEITDITRVQSFSSDPDPKFDFLEGDVRLKSLETAIKTTRIHWDDDQARGALNWIRAKENQMLLIKDLNESKDGGSEYPSVWEAFGWSHNPINTNDSNHQNLEIARIVTNNILKLSDSTLRLAINGISHWISSWEKYLIKVDVHADVSFRLWPVAVEVTNIVTKDLEAFSEEPDNIHLQRDDNENIDTLNNPVGKIVGVFLEYCPNLQSNKNPFKSRSRLKKFRDTLIETEGYAGLVVRNRLMQSLPYFFKADQKWAKKYLLGPLKSENESSNALWRSLSRGRPNFEILEIIGDQMAQKASDLSLSRDTRKALAFYLVLESLFSYEENRNPAIPYNRITQMIRSLDDEVRAYAADTLSKFINDLTAEEPQENKYDFSKSLFDRAVLPFLEIVWPKERSLSMPGVSKALADLPAATKGAFVEAVNAIEPYLVPFDCWSLYEIGFMSQNLDTDFSIINSDKEAEALLRLLDNIIGKSDDSVIPNDLPNALDKIKEISPGLTDFPTYRRLFIASLRT